MKKVIDWYNTTHEDRARARLWTVLKLPVEWRSDETKWTDWSYDDDEDDVIQFDTNFVPGFKVRLKP